MQKKDTLDKSELIEQIKLLINTNADDSVDINPNYLEYFELEELENIMEELKNRKKEIDKLSKEYVDHLYEKLS
jgi:hypothetical protein